MNTPTQTCLPGQLTPEQLRNRYLFLYARSYDPSVGRFSTLDPFGGNDNDPQSLHKYMYAHGNPIMGIDPLGESWSMVGKITTVSIIVGIVGTWVYTGLNPFEIALESFSFYTAGMVSFPIRTTDRGRVWMYGDEFMRKYHQLITDIAREYKIPPKLLASVIYTEMRNISGDDLMDDVKANRSYGGVQLRAQNILNPDYGMTLGHGKTLDEIEIMLETPSDMITLVAQGMLAWDRRYLGPDVIDGYRNATTPKNKAYWAGYMSSLKDKYNEPTPGIKGSYGYLSMWQDRGIESWEMIDQWNIFDDE